MVRIQTDLPHTSVRREDAPQWRAPLGSSRRQAPSDAGVRREKPISLFIVPPRAQASRRCETTSDAKAASRQAPLAFRSLDPFRALRELDRRRRDEERPFPLRTKNRLTGKGRVGVWRSGGRPSIAVAAPFVWRCLNGSTIAPFPHPAHRTGQADFPHPGFVCQGGINPFLSSFVIPFFCSTCAASILSSRPHICIAVAHSGGQGRRLFSAAEGLSLTDASTAAGC